MKHLNQTLFLGLCLTLSSGCNPLGNEKFKLAFNDPDAIKNLKSQVSNISVVNNQLVVTGSTLGNIKTATLRNGSQEEVFQVQSASDSQIIANGTRAISIVAGAVFDLILADAYGSATFQVTFTLADGVITAAKLHPMGATAGQVLQFNGTNWAPAAISASSTPSVVTLTDAPTITPDAANGSVFNLTLGENRTLANPGHLVNGQIYTFRITQDATGGHSLTWGSNYIFGGLAYNSQFNTGANQLNVYTFISDGVVLHSTGFFGTCARGSKTFNYTGSDQVFTVPSGACPNMTVKVWGAGGGGGTHTDVWSYGSPGGGGGFTSGALTLNPGTIWKVVVGQGGPVNSNSNSYGGGGASSCNGADNRYSGNGGGLSGLFSGNTAVFSGGTPEAGAQARAILIAGGGGGGSASRAGAGNVGGAGGGLTAADGASPYDDKSSYAGHGGSQSAPGATADSDNVNCGATAGALVGGAPTTHSYGGGGGAGYFGGSAGGYSEPNTMGGGGGGSSFISTSVSNSALSAGSGATAANTGDADYSAGVGVGGGDGIAGGSGLVVISW